jgi:outer membrane protein
MIKNKYLIVLVSTNVLVVIAIGISLWTHLRTPKIAYVKTQKVLEQYIGIKEARNLYQDKLNVWQAKIDSLSSGLNTSINSYHQKYSSLSTKERMEYENSLNAQKESVLTQKANLEQKAREENDQLTQGALNQINSYIEEYGKNHDYDIVHGVTLSGNVLYADDRIDITDAVIKGLNNTYKK